ncbi:MAG: hypothetical protein LDL31_03565 [Prosthecobacter sp.]|nr:hypothetical protein [Prosthecobacter sp.]
MKKLPAFCCLVLSMLLNVSSCLAGGAETVAQADRPRLALYAEEFTLDGKARPDLARAVTEALTRAFLQRGQVRLFNLESAALQDAAGTLAATSAVTAARRVDHLMTRGLDYVLTYSVVGIRQRHVLTVKKMRASTHEILLSRQFTHVGEPTGVLTLMARVLDEFDPVTTGRPGVFPRSQSPAMYLPEPTPPSPPIVVARALPAGHPVIMDHEPAYDPWAQNLHPPYDLSRVPKALVYRHLGTVHHIDYQWKFCIINPVGGTRFQEQDPMHILWEEGDVYAPLRVSSVERGGVVLDMGRTPDHHPIFIGDKVYGWAPPLR